MRYDRRGLALAGAVALMALAGCTGAPAHGGGAPFVKGADVSFLDAIDSRGGRYFERGVSRDCLEILRDHGIDLIRLRIWNDPLLGFSDLERTVAMGQRVKRAGMQFLLDFHYSDTWADPGKQTKPAKWRGLGFEELRQALYSYSKDVIRALAEAGAAPDIVQVGNEITQGFLWDDGRVGGVFDTPAQWQKLAQLLRAAIAGIHDGAGAGARPRIMIHIDRGGDNQGARWFFDRLLGQGVEFDMIGLSFYPWWHGTLDRAAANMVDLARRYQKDIMVVETAYPWTLDEKDGHPNIVRRADQLHPGYPASVDGQAAFLRDLIGVVRGLPDDRGRGVVYWEPEYISLPQLGGSPWENLTLFDFEASALASLDVFRAM